MRVDAVTGGCLCGAVRFTYTGLLGGELGKVTLCLCEQCRKAQGFAAAVAPAEAGGLTISNGAQQIREFESSPGKHRAFCTQCGSPLYSRLDSRPEALRLRLGAFDDLPESLAVQAVIFTEDAPAWTRPESAPRYGRREPDRT